jgi:serine protease Do
MPFPIEPEHGEPENDFLIQDPFGLRMAVTPFFSFDLHDGMLSAPRTGESVGIGTSFYVTPFGRQLSAMHVTTDFLNERKARLQPSPEKNLLELKGTWIGVYHDPGLVFGARPAGTVLAVNDIALFPVDQSKDPAAIFSPPDRLNHIEPSLDLAGWNIAGLKGETVFLPIRIACPASVAVGDRVLAVGYPDVRAWRSAHGASMVSYQEQMRGSFGRIIELSRAWEQDRKIWPTIIVDVGWKGGMSGGPVFNENGDVIGIVSRGANAEDTSQAYSTALWLEALPFNENIYGNIDPRNPGWIVGWGACHAHSAVKLFQTKEEAAAFVQGSGPGLSVKRCSMLHPMRYRRPDARPRGSVR